MNEKQGALTTFNCARTQTGVVTSLESSQDAFGCERPFSSPEAMLTTLLCSGTWPSGQAHSSSLSIPYR